MGLITGDGVLLGILYSQRSSTSVDSPVGGAYNRGWGLTWDIV